MLSQATKSFRFAGIGKYFFIMTDVTKQRSVAITGAGSGLGRDIALGLAAKGYRVFGTAVAAQEISDLQKASDGRVVLSTCDIGRRKGCKEVVS